MHMKMLFVILKIRLCISKFCSHMKTSFVPQKIILYSCVFAFVNCIVYIRKQGFVTKKNIILGLEICRIILRYSVT